MTLIQASARAIPLADESVQCVVTSPPYWGLRSYEGEQREVWGGEPGHAHEWGVQERVGGGKQDGEGRRWQHTGGGVSGHRAVSSESCACGARYGALGLEPTPDLYVEHIVEVFREVRRVLRKDGTLWLNLGDSYATGAGKVGERPGGGAQGDAWAGQRGSRGGSAKQPHTGNAIGPMIQPNRMPQEGLKPKDLVGIPWMVAFALRADGWYLRSDIIWHKPNPMPESVTDRPTKSHEYLFLLTKSQTYYYDADAIREPVAASSLARVSQNNGHPTFAAARTRREAGHIEGADTLRADQLVPEGGRNKRDVWTIATHPYAEAHFATYPEALVEPCIMAGSSAQACGVCGAPWERVSGRDGTGPEFAPLAIEESGALPDGPGTHRNMGGGRYQKWLDNHPRETTGWQPTCEHDDGSAASRVLDPFNGSGTTGAVALRLGREYVGTDISAEYLAMAERRIGAVTPVATTVEHAARVAGTKGAQLTMGAGL